MIKTLVFTINLLILKFCSSRELHLIDPFENIKSHIKLRELLVNYSNKTEIIQQNLANKDFMLNISEGNFSLKELHNETDFCSEKTDEILKYFLNPQNSTLTFEDLKAILLYSSVGLNDYGDYTNCVNTPDYNYVSLILNFGGISSRMALCYYKACNATYFNNSKSKIINLLNARYGMNLTDANIFFTNPKDSMDDYRKKSETGFIILTVFLSVIALCSVLKLILTLLGYGHNKRPSEFNKKPNAVSGINETYENLKDQSSNNLADDSDQISASKYKNNSGVLFAFLENFDVLKNTKAVFNVSNPNKTFEYLRVFDGVRVLSTAWVLWGHIFFVSLGIGPKNFYDAVKLAESFHYCILLSALVSVDVFFYMSGFLLYFNLQKYLKHAKNKITFFFVSLFQRYVRLLPFYFIAVFYMSYLLPFLIDSGKSDSVFPFLEGCRKYWWSNVLYIQNHINYDDNKGSGCAGHTWYLGDDMIYFIVTLLILLVISKRKTVQYLIILALFIGSCVWSIIKVLNNNYSINVKKLAEVKGNYFYDFYVQPFARITPYLLGILYCELFFETDLYLNKTDSNKENSIISSTDTENPDKDQYQILNQKKEENSYLRKINVYLKENDVLCVVIFVISLIFINYTVFMNRFYQMYNFPPGWEAFTLTFNKIFFIIGLGNIIHLIFLEKFSFVKDFLSAKIFSQLSRLTYGVYILHYYLITVFFYNTDSAITVNFLEYSFFAIGIMIISLFFSYFLGILFESPVINMLKFMKREPKNSVKNLKKTESD